MNVKEQILNSAESLFFEKGFHATGIRDIANDAAVNSSMISYYFQSKENLYLELIKRIEVNFQTDIFSMQLGMNTMDNLKNFVIKTKKVFDELPKTVHLIMVEQLQASSEKAQSIIQNIQSSHYEFFCKLFKNQNIISTNNKIKIIYFTIWGVIKESCRLKNSSLNNFISPQDNMELEEELYDLLENIDL